MTMKSVDLPHLRSVVLAGHAGSGKTTLGEQLLHRAGAVTRLGKVDDGSSHLDFEPEEQKRQISISLAVLPFEWEGHKVNLLDTPGYADFIGDVEAALRVADLAVDQLDGCDMAGVTLVQGETPTTAVFTEDDAPEIDRAQYDTGRGPCVAAYRTGEILRIDDTLADDRWPEFAASAAAHGVRSTLSLPLLTGDSILGALNLYSRTTSAFDGVTSAWITPQSCAAARPSASWRAIATTSPGGSGPRRSTRVDRLSPSISSMTKYGRPSGT